MANITGIFVSSAITHATYIQAERYLYLTFGNGRRYRFDGVPMPVATGLFFAKSAGKYFNSKIKNKYTVR